MSRQVTKLPSKDHLNCYAKWKGLDNHPTTKSNTALPSGFHRWQFQWSIFSLLCLPCHCKVWTIRKQKSIPDSVSSLQCLGPSSSLQQGFLYSEMSLRTTFWWITQWSVFPLCTLTPNTPIDNKNLFLEPFKIKGEGSQTLSACSVVKMEFGYINSFASSLMANLWLLQ